jgi:hypothetical protein
VPAAAEDQHLRAFRGFQQDLGRMAPDDAGTDLDRLGMLPGDVHHRSSEDPLGDRGKTVPLVADR